MTVADLWALEMLLAAFAGGAFGASIGALPSFSLVGLVVILGERYRLATRTLGGGPLPVDITGSIGFGVVLGPHVAFGISVFALVFLNADVAEIPVTHHIALPASTAVLALVGVPTSELTPAVIAGGIPLWVALVVGAGFGIVGAIVGAVLQRIFYAHAETHLDPPAASIVVTSLLIGGLAMVGVLPSSVRIPLP